MTDVDKLEIWLTGYLECMVGKECSKENIAKVIGTVDMMLHKINLDRINDVDWQFIKEMETLKVPNPPDGKKYSGLFD